MSARPAGFAVNLTGRKVYTSMNQELRERFERERRSRLICRIATLQCELEELGQPRARWELHRVSAVRSEIARLTFELKQPMLLPV
jgi:hypothetical protein